MVRNSKKTVPTEEEEGRIIPAARDSLMYDSMASLRSGHVVQTGWQGGTTNQLHSRMDDEEARKELSLS